MPTYKVRVRFGRDSTQSFDVEIDAASLERACQYVEDDLITECAHPGHAKTTLERGAGPTERDQVKCEHCGEIFYEWS